MGAWYVVPLPKKIDRMHAVHAILLPSGKVLIVNGSVGRMVTENGVFKRAKSSAKYKNTNFTALFDPFDPDKDGKSTGFTKIASPDNPIVLNSGDEPNDP